MKLVVLIENTALDSQLQAEHGLAMYVEKDGFRFLFDTGETNLFMQNAETLGIDLSHLDAVAFSHNHYDHCGGFLSFAQRKYPACPVYAHTGFFRRKWWDHSLDAVEEATYEPAMELVGPIMGSEYFFQNGYPRFRMISGDIFELTKDIYLVGNFPQERGEEVPHPSSKMELDPDTFVPDQFRDEQICVIRTKKGLVLLTGCAHNGIMNIMRTVEQRFPGETIYAVFGGTHLTQSQMPRIVHTIAYINEKNLAFAGVCHCTGENALAMFKEQIPSYQKIGAGYIWTDEEA